MRTRVTEITSASKEQAQGLEQLNKAMADIDEVTQRNVANAEGSASAARKLSVQAERIRNFASELIGPLEGNQSRSGGATGRNKKDASPEQDVETNSHPLLRPCKTNGGRRD